MCSAAFSLVKMRSSTLTQGSMVSPAAYFFIVSQEIGPKKGLDSTVTPILPSMIAWSASRVPAIDTTVTSSPGRKPGEDVTVVSIDGTRDALQAIVDGKLGATVECNPRFGPKAYETLEKYAAGEQIPPKIINEDKFYDESNAQQELPNAY